MILCFASCHKTTLPKPIPSYPIQMDVAKAIDTPIFIEALGHVEPITSVHIYSRIEGELTGIYFNQGEEVKQGDLLFTIDPKPYEAALLEAQGVFEESLANLALAEEKVKRYQTLTKNDFYSQIDYETLQTNMAALKAQTEANRAQVEKAKINLSYCWVYAPIDGKTGILQIDYGNLIFVGSSSPLITLNQMTPIFVTFSIPEFELPKIQKALKNGPLKTVAAYDHFESDDLFQGVLYMLDNQVDPNTGMLKLRALFENANRELWPGQFIRNRLITNTIKNSVTIPFSAVQMTQTEPIVFVVKEDMTVEQRTVQLGQRNDQEVIVLRGVLAGEKIVTEGQMNLYTGSKVFVAEHR